MKKTILLLITITFLTSCSLLNITPSKRINKISFNKNSIENNCDFIFSDYTNNEYLKKFREQYEIEKLTKNAKNDLEKVLILLDWTNSKWKHSGSNTPSKSDAFVILEEASQGKKFRCVEYAIVVSTALNSIGLLARTLGLKTKDVEKVKYGAGHVVTEVYLNDKNKWIFIDGQTNLIPFIDNVPLNAVELQEAIIESREKIELKSLNKIENEKDKNKYIKWVAPYLYYFDTYFDNRKDYKIDYIKCKEKTRLMLVPIGAKEPKVFQRKHPMSNLIYTNSYKEFYKKPKIKRQLTLCKRNSFL